jgi:hypothetical protein
MIPVPANVRVWIATGHSDMRRGMNGLALPPDCNITVAAPAWFKATNS